MVAEVSELISEEILDRTEVRGSEVDSEVLMVRGIEVLIDKLLSKLLAVEAELPVIETDKVEDDNPVVVARLDPYVIVCGHEPPEQIVLMG